MENGIGVGYDAKVGEEYDFDEKKNLFSEAKDSDEDKDVEEAVEIGTPAIDSDDNVIIGSRSEEMLGTLKNGDGNSELICEVPKFEEVVGASNTVQNSEDSGARSELLTSKEHSDENAFSDEVDTMNGLLHGSNLMDQKGGSEESYELAYVTDDPTVVNEFSEELEESFQKPEHALSDSFTSVTNLASERVQIAGDATGEEPTLESVGADIDNEKLYVKGYIPETAEMQDANEVKGGYVRSEKREDEILDHSSLSVISKHENSEVRNDNELKDHPHETLEVEYANMGQVTDAVPSLVTVFNGDALHDNGHNACEVNEIVPALGSGSSQDKAQTTFANPLELGDQVAEDCEEVPFTSVFMLKDDGKTEPHGSDPESVVVTKVDSQIVDKEENVGIYGTNGVGESSTFDRSLPPVGDGAAELEIAEVGNHNFSSTLFSELSQHQIVDADADGSEAVVESPEKEGLNGTKDQSTTGNKAHEIGPVAGVESSSGNSLIPDINRANPADIQQVDKVQERVSKDVFVNREQEGKPPAGLSSSSVDAAASHPPGIGRSTVLLESAGQNHSGKSRSAVDNPANVPSASPSHPAGLGGSAPLLESASRVVPQPRVNGGVSPTQNQLVEDPANGEAEEYDETREKLQMIRVKFLRLAHRLGQTPHNVVVAQVLYRLGLAEQLRGRSGSRVAAFSFDRASAMAEQLEAAGQEPLDFTCTIMVLGKSGVGKSATINSIFDEVKFSTDAFQFGTKNVQDIVGTVQGIRVRVIDTPGLLPSWSDQRQNEKILRSVKRFIQKTPPDIVLYLDRLDMQSRDFGDMPLLRTITDIFGPSIWFNAIVVLTHAASAPPEGPNGTATSYDMFVTQRSHVVQQAIRQAAGDMRLMNPVSLVENHSACRTNRAGQRVLPNGQVWKPHLLLLSFASKILAEANTLLKFQDSPPGRPFTSRTRPLPLPSLLSSLLQSRPEVNVPSEQFGSDDDSVDDELDEDSESKDEPEYDELPPFKSLTKAQLSKLTKAQRKGYYDELEYRERLLMKKQLKEEKKRRKMMKEMQEAAKDQAVHYGEYAEEETSGAASVPVPVPDLALPASFDSDNPTYRYRSLDSSSPWLVRAVLEPNGWDHDIGYDGINVERLFVLRDKVPVSFSGHISKDKKDTNLQMDISSSLKHGKGKATTLGFDMQSMGKDTAYTFRSETRFSNHKMNRAVAGFSATLLGDALTGGMKLEDKLIVGKMGELVVTGGSIYGRGEVAYGGSLEATLRDKTDPLARFLLTLGLSVMDWHGDLAIGSNAQVQIPVGRHTNMMGRFIINNRGSGQVSVRVSSSEQLQIILIGLIPLAKKLFGYSQEVQYG